MNSEQAKQIPMINVLERLGIFPVKMNDKEAFFKSPFRNEKTASFKVNIKENIWHDFGDASGGTIIDFLIIKFNFTVTEALRYLEPHSGSSSFSFQQQESLVPSVADNYTIDSVTEIKHDALVHYLLEREIKNYQSAPNLYEVHYTNNGKNYFGIGFKNNSQGWEIRNKIMKLCLGKKDVTTIKNNSNTVIVFEGFFDYLSFVELQKTNKKESVFDFLILNSTSQLNKNIDLLKDYKFIKLCMDNDDTGENATKMIIDKFNHAVDLRGKYKEFKDLNEQLINKIIGNTTPKDNDKSIEMCQRVHKSLRI